MRRTVSIVAAGALGVIVGLTVWARDTFRTMTGAR